MKLSKKIRKQLAFALYRLLRNDLVRRMRVNGMTWTRINNVLRILGQKQIVRIQRTAKGDLLTFANVDMKTVREVKHGKVLNKTAEITPEIINLN